MKIFLQKKCGYTSGVYGCSGEYFDYTVITDENISTFTISGLYGAEERVSAKLKSLGYTEKYNSCNTYGKLTRKDIMRVVSEHEAINNIDELIRHGYIENNK